MVNVLPSVTMPPLVLFTVKPPKIDNEDGKVTLAVPFRFKLEFNLVTKEPVPFTLPPRVKVLPNSLKVEPLLSVRLPLTVKLPVRYTCSVLEIVRLLNAVVVASV